MFIFWNYPSMIKIVQMTPYKILILKVVAVAYERFYSERFVRENLVFWTYCSPLPEVVAHGGYTVCELNVRDKPLFLHPSLPSPRAIVSRFVLSRASTCLSTPNSAFCADKQALGVS